MLAGEVRPALYLAATMFSIHSNDRNKRFCCLPSSSKASSFRPISSKPRQAAMEGAVPPEKKPPICTADELHFVPVPGTQWRLALWRYTPPSNAPLRNHPLMLLSGVGTNAIGFDLSPESSFAHYMSSQGFDTWIVEFRGAGLSTRDGESMEAEKSANTNFTLKLMQSIEEGVSSGAISTEQPPDINSYAQPESETVVVNGNKQETLTTWDESQLVMKLTETLLALSERLSGFLNENQLKIISARFIDQLLKLLEDAQLAERFNDIRERLSGLLESRANSGIATQTRDLSQKIVNILMEGQKSVSPLFNLQERLSTTIENFQKQLDLMVKYNWDFDNYLEEDVPAAMEYVRALTKPKDGKLLAIGHSMGGILLYAMLSRHAFEGGDSRLAAVVTLASSLDYTPSRSYLKYLVPLADPAQALNVPVVPLGALMAAAYPLATGPPYVLSWINALVSAQDMMLPELYEKLVLNNFCTIPAKLLLQLTTSFREGGLRDRSGTFLYKDHLHKTSVPILALAADQDLICPPEAVYETVKTLPQQLVTYKLFGQPDGPHYGHYDLVGGRLMVDEVFPCIIEFLTRHDV